MADLQQKLRKIRDELQLLRAKTSLTEGDETRVQTLESGEQELLTVLRALGEQIDESPSYMFYRGMTTKKTRPRPKRAG